LRKCRAIARTNLIWLSHCPWKHFDWGNVHCLIPFLGIKGVNETKNNKTKKKDWVKCLIYLLLHVATALRWINPWGGNISKGQQGIQKFSIPFLELLSPTSSCITFLFLGLCQTTWLTKTFSLPMLTITSSSAFLWTSLLSLDFLKVQLLKLVTLLLEHCYLALLEEGGE